MRGVVFLGERELEPRDFPDPAPGPGEVVLAMKASGDVRQRPASLPGASQGRRRGRPRPRRGERARHRRPRALRRRGRAGPGRHEAQAPTGQRVMNHHYKGCGLCKHSCVGWSQLCPHGIVVYGMTAHGGHAPYMTADRLFDRQTTGKGVFVF